MRSSPRMRGVPGFRCVYAEMFAQIHGASKDAVAHARRVIDIEINSTTTNPLIFPDTEEVRLGGNFHGQPVAMAADYLSMGLAELGSVSERRIERMVNPQLSELPAFLVHEGGINSGYMIGQYARCGVGIRKQGSGPSGLCGFHSHVRPTKRTT